MGSINPTLAIGLPTYGKVSVGWAQSYRHLGGPLGSSAMELVVKGKPIAEARNEIMREAINGRADFVFMLGDDVVAPPDAMIRMLDRFWLNPDLHLITGVYWTKMFPTQPYLWRGIQRGPYLDWTVGEWFPVDFAGCDCLMIRLSSEVKALGPEWFCTEYHWDEGQDRPSPLMTEDFFFYTRARRAGIKLWCDSGIQCLHEDRNSGMLFGLLPDMPQAGAKVPELPDPGEVGGPVTVADLGSGANSPHFGPPDKVTVVRFDLDESVHPDFRCDLRRLPVRDEQFDLVHARHVLEHFGRTEAQDVLREWVRILRVGGEIRINVPNVIAAMRAIIDVADGKREPDLYPWWQIYGAQATPLDRHFNGWTERRLRAVLELTGVLGEIVVEEADDGINLAARAKKVRSGRPLVFAREWHEIAQQEGIDVPGLNYQPSESSVTGSQGASIVRPGENVSDNGRSNESNKVLSPAARETVPADPIATDDSAVKEHPE